MNQEPCGCYCIQDVSDSLKPNPYKIVFCPLHEAAGELFRALKLAHLALESLYHGDENDYDAHQAEIEKAIAKAKGGK